MSDMLNTTRASVWKHIQSLKEEGIAIDSLTNKGYRLAKEQQVLCPAFLQPLLTTTHLGRSVTSLPHTPSTNRVARELAQQGAPHGAVVLAELQTEGRGRRGRSWQNHAGKDLCISILLRPMLEAQQASRLTIATALGVHAMCRAFQMHPSIKWPNDLLLQGKKFCGILLEVEGTLEQIESIVVGIGINVNTVEFPEDIAAAATSMSIALQKKLNRIEVLGALLNILEPLYARCETDFPALLSEYKSHCETIGQFVTVTGIRETLHGLVADVDEFGCLQLKTDDGKLHTLYAGDVTLRKTAQD